MNSTDTKRYHNWVRQQPCALCGAHGVHLSHYTGYSAHRFGKARGRKCHDVMVCPLCPGCHGMFDRYELSHFEDRTMRQIDQSERMLVLVAQTITQAVDAGVMGLGVTP